MSILTNFIEGKNRSCVPIWFMRQAGRYLPEFREIRLKNPDFIKLCMNSDLSAEITLQPIKRFNLDAAIIFSDILIVPYALGQEVVFKKNEGPVLSRLDNNTFLGIGKNQFSEKLNPVYKAIEKTRKKLDKKKSLIAFVGAPWTLLTYIFTLKKSDNQLDQAKFDKVKNDLSKILLELIEYLKTHIQNQINAGADVVQIFDSWAGLLPENDLNNFCYTPNKILVNYCKSKNIPVISFPKGINKKYKDFVKVVNPNVINIDYNINPKWARDNIEGTCLQGGMDPKILLENEDIIFNETKKYLDIFKNKPYIFNLGHGLLPSTNPDKVMKLINCIRENKI